MAYNNTNTNNQWGGCPGGSAVVPATAIINCDLQVALNPENTAVYVCKGAQQCFNFTALQCCGKGDIKIDYVSGGTVNNSTGEIIVANFGTFSMNKSGICVKLVDDIKVDSVKLTFKASSCGVENYFDVKFVYDPCRCCCKCRKCR